MGSAAAKEVNHKTTIEGVIAERDLLTYRSPIADGRDLYSVVSKLATWWFDFSHGYLLSMTSSTDLGTSPYNNTKCAGCHHVYFTVSVVLPTTQ